MFSLAPVFGQITYQGGDGPGEGKHIVFVASDHEYRAEETCPALARILAQHQGFKTTVLFGPFEYTTVLDMSQSNSTITLDNLYGGSSYMIQFSISLYEGIL